MDEFNWDVYPSALDKQQQGEEGYNTLYISDGSFSISSGEVILRDGEKPLNTSHKLVVDTLLKLHPKSMLEVGCGLGINILNAWHVFPNMLIYGMDRSRDMLSITENRFHEMISSKRVLLKHGDITKEVPTCRTEVVFSRAVLQHIHGEGRDEASLRNMFLSADKYVFLVENWRKHRFFDMMVDIGGSVWGKDVIIQRLHSGKRSEFSMIASTKALVDLPIVSGEDEVQQLASAYLDSIGNLIL